MKNLIALFFAIAFTGCTTLQDASNGKGTGTAREFDKSYNVVWDTALQIIDESKLDLVASQKEDGKILAQKGMSAFSYGENVAVFVTEKSAKTTEVEVVSKRALATNIVAKNWASHILDAIEKLLN